jgi:outer membrane protein assembly factor BamB
MILRRSIAFGAFWMLAAALPTQAQVHFAQDLIPTRSALERVGLEKRWSVVVPLDRSDERVIQINLDDGQVFAQTNRGYIHAFDAERGTYQWGAHLGWPTATAFPITVNKDYALAANSTFLHALDRRTGRAVWKATLDGGASSSTGVDDKLAVVGLAKGKLEAFNLYRTKAPNRGDRSPGTFAWTFATNATISARPIIAGPLVVFASTDGKVYATIAKEHKMLYRFLTGGPITGSLGTHGIRTLLVPSHDGVLYALDLYTGETKWTVTSGAALKQEPVVAGDNVFVSNADGRLFAIDVPTGQIRWVTPTHDGLLLAVSQDRVFLLSEHRDLTVIDRKSGRPLHSARDTHQGAGLNLRSYSLGYTNDQNDRIYLATPSGHMICLSQAGHDKPVPLRDPNEPVFGTLPDDDNPLGTPPVPPTAVDPTAPDDEPQPEKPF